MASPNGPPYDLAFIDVHMIEVNATADRVWDQTGQAGGLYRRIVISTGGHVVAVRRLLAAIMRRAEGR